MARQRTGLDFNASYFDRAKGGMAFRSPLSGLSGSTPDLSNVNASPLAGTGSSHAGQSLNGNGNGADPFASALTNTGLSILRNTPTSIYKTPNEEEQYYQDSIRRLNDAASRAYKQADERAVASGLVHSGALVGEYGDIGERLVQGTGEQLRALKKEDREFADQSLVSRTGLAANIQGQFAGQKVATAGLMGFDENGNPTEQAREFNIGAYGYDPTPAAPGTVSGAAGQPQGGPIPGYAPPAANGRAAAAGGGVVPGTPGSTGTGLAAPRLTLAGQKTKADIAAMQADTKIRQDAQALADRIQTGQLTIQQAAQELDAEVKRGNLSNETADQILRRAQVFGKSGPIAKGAKTLAATGQAADIAARDRQLSQTEQEMYGGATVKNADGTTTFYPTLKAQLQSATLTGKVLDPTGAKNSDGTPKLIDTQQALNDAVDRAFKRGSATGQYKDPVTGLTYDTLAKKGQTADIAARDRQLSQAEQDMYGGATVKNPDGTMTFYPTLKAKLQSATLTGKVLDPTGAKNSDGTPKLIDTQQALNDAVDRAAKQGALTGRYKDPVTGLTRDTLAKKQVDNQVKQFAQELGLNQQKVNLAVQQFAASVSPAMRSFALIAQSYKLDANGNPIAMADGSPMTAADKTAYNKAKADFLTAYSDAEDTANKNFELQKANIDAQTELKKQTMILNAAIAFMGTKAGGNLVDAGLSALLRLIGYEMKDGKIVKKDDSTVKKDDSTPKKDDSTPKKDDSTPKKDDPTTINLAKGIRLMGFPDSSAQDFAEYLVGKGYTNLDDPKVFDEFFNWQNERNFDSHGNVIPKTKSERQPYDLSGRIARASSYLAMGQLAGGIANKFSKRAGDVLRAASVGAAIGEFIPIPGGKYVGAFLGAGIEFLGGGKSDYEKEENAIKGYLDERRVHYGNKDLGIFMAISYMADGLGENKNNILDGVLAAFGSKREQEDYAPDLDIDDNGVIDQKDMLLVAHDMENRLSQKYKNVDLSTSPPLASAALGYARAHVGAQVSGLSGGPFEMMADVDHDGIITDRDVQALEGMVGEHPDPVNTKLTTNIITQTDIQNFPLGSKKGDANYRPEFDYNGNGENDYDDYGALADNTRDIGGGKYRYTPAPGSAPTPAVTSGLSSGFRGRLEKGLGNQVKAPVAPPIATPPPPLDTRRGQAAAPVVAPVSGPQQPQAKSAPVVAPIAPAPTAKPKSRVSLFANAPLPGIAATIKIDDMYYDVLNNGSIVNTFTGNSIGRTNGWTILLNDDTQLPYPV